MNVKLSAGKFVACNRAQKNKMDNRTITDEINDELLMSFIPVFRCLYAKKIKSHKDQGKKVDAWKEIREGVGILVERCSKSYKIQNLCLVIRFLSSFPRCWFLLHTSNKNNIPQQELPRAKALTLAIERCTNPK